MTKRTVVLSLVLLFALCTGASAALIKDISWNESGSNLKIVVYLDSAAKYEVTKGNLYSIITISGVTPAKALPQKIDSAVLEGVNVTASNDTCVISANYKYLTSSKVYALKNPSRIVADFTRISKSPLPKLAVPEIERIETKSLPEKFKVVIGLTSFAPYVVLTAESGLVIEVPDMNSVIKSRKITTHDKLVPSISIDQVGKNVLISIDLTYPAFYQIYKLDNPSRLVIEFDKESRSTVAATDVAPAGLRYIKIIKGTEAGPSTVNLIFVDQRLFNVFPYLSPREGSEPGGILDSIMGIFSLWSQKEDLKFKMNTVSNMVKETDSVAGINGTFFSGNGEPIGVLMINGELISYSINDRTAFIIDRDNKCYIDNVSLSGRAVIDGRTIDIAGINTKRMTGQAIVYTPRYGNETREEDPGIILSVVNGEVKNISRNRGWIPADGYVLSMDPSYYGALGDRVKVGSRVDLQLTLIPLSSIPHLDTKHVIGGGPRLVKSDQLYISRNSEKFRKDVSQSRASRTAVGITKDGTLIFAAVDKCRVSETGKSVGMTLEELASLMKELGCVDAMNLDGGSSTTMVVSGEVVNTPSSGSEIRVSNSILIKKP